MAPCVLRMKKEVTSVSADAMTALMNGRWPGNVRELELAVEPAVILECALERFGGNRRKAAEALKISTVALWRKMTQFGVSS
jgi:DNA-binding NtrC family response regulator